MKRLLAFALTLLASLNAYCQDWNWQEVGKGVQAGYARVELFNSMQSISVLRYKASKHVTDIINDPAEMADSTSALAAKYRGRGAINGSYFDVRRLTPATFVKDEGVPEGYTLPAESYRTDGIVAVRGRRKVAIMPCDTASYDAATRRFREALASGPLLLQGGRPVRDEWPDDSFFTSRHPRTLMGTTSDGWVYFIVIDGRAAGNADGATIAEASQIALILGLDDAINLDGGGSSTLWNENLGVISHPCDNRKFDHFGQRKVPNVIIFR